MLQYYRLEFAYADKMSQPKLKHVPMVGYSLIMCFVEGKNYMGLVKTIVIRQLIDKGVGGCHLKFKTTHQQRGWSLLIKILKRNS